MTKATDDLLLRNKKWALDSLDKKINTRNSRSQIACFVEECIETFSALGASGDELDGIRQFRERVKPSDDKLVDEIINLRSPHLPGETNTEQAAETIDGFADVIFTAVTSLTAMGYDALEIFKRVMDSNDSKRLQDGSFNRNEFGKITKPTHYRKPEWDDIVNKPNVNTITPESPVSLLVIVDSSSGENQLGKFFLKTPKYGVRITPTQTEGKWYFVRSNKEETLELKSVSLTTVLELVDETLDADGIDKYNLAVVRIIDKLHRGMIAYETCGELDPTTCPVLSAQ